MTLAYEQAVKLMNQYPELQDFVGKRDNTLRFKHNRKKKKRQK